MSEDKRVPQDLAAQELSKVREENEYLRKTLACVRDNLRKGMGKGMQQLQARSIDEVLKGDRS